ncbi:MAG: hypothetical protein ABIN83_07420, partial [Sphingomicrobium sp.]
MPFTPKFVDMARNATSSTGTGAISLGVAISGFTSISDAVAVGEQFYYCIQGVDKPAEREVGRGTMQAGGMVARQPIAGPATNFTTGTKTIALVTAAEWFAKIEAGGAGGAKTSGPFINLVDYLASSRTPFVTDDLPAFTAALAEMKALMTAGAGIGVPRLIVPAGRYYCSDTLNVHLPCLIEGAGGNGGVGTIIRFAANKNGIVFNYANTHGDGLGSQGNSSGSMLEGVSLWGGNVTVNPASGAVTSFANGSSPSGHGVRIRAPFVALKDVAVSCFGGNGFDVNASSGSGGASEGNANNFYLERCQSTYNGAFGYLFNGVDANAGTTNTCSAIDCAGGGIVEYSFLGNTHIQGHVRDCGRSDATGCNNPVGACIYGGSTYYVRADKLTQASTTVPGTDPSVWLPWGGPAGRAWVTGKTWIAGGPYMTNPANVNGRNVFLGCYAESGNPPIQAFAPSLMIGGLLDEVGLSPLSTAAWQRGTGDGGIGVRGTLKSVGDGSAGESGLGGLDGSTILTHQAPGTFFRLFRDDAWGGGRALHAQLNNSGGSFYLTLDGDGPFGFNAFFVPRFILGNGNGSGGCWVSTVNAPGDCDGQKVPTGSVFFNANPAPGQRSGFMCTAGGVGGAGATFADLPPVGLKEASAAEVQAGAIQNRFVSPKILFDAAAEVALADGASIGLDLATGINFSVTLAGNRALA